MNETASSLYCSSCSLDFPLDHGIADFARGDDCDRFDGSTGLSEEHLAALRSEEAGTCSRIRRFYLSKLRTLRARLEGPPDGFRVLDCGCGNGLSVDLLRGEWTDAWGVDLSLLRKWQWKDREFRQPVKAFLRVTEVPALRFLAGTPLNPYIVAEIRRL